MTPVYLLAHHYDLDMSSLKSNPVQYSWNPHLSAEENLPPVIKFQNDHVRRLRPEDSGRKYPSIAYMGYRTEAPEYAVTVLTCGDTMITEPSGRRWGRVDRSLDGSTRTLPPKDNEVLYPSGEVIVDFADSQGLVTSWARTPLSEEEVLEMGDRALSGQPDPEPGASWERASPGLASVTGTNMTLTLRPRQ